MMIYSLTTGSLSVFLRILSFAVLLIPASASSQFSYSSGADLFISEDSYLYIEQPVILTITDAPPPKSSPASRVAAPKPTVSKASSKTLASGPSSESKRNPSFKFIPFENTHHFSTPGSFSSLAVLGTSSPVKYQQKTIPSSFILLISTRRDKEKPIHVNFSPFQMAHIIINHFGRPPPISNTNDTGFDRLSLTRSQMTRMSERK